VITEPGIYPDIDEAEYHSGKWLPEPSLSVSGAKRLLRTSPAQWKWEQDNKPVKKVFEFGQAAHSKVLGVGVKVATIPADLLASNGAASTKAAKEWIAEQRAAGIVPLKAEEMAVVDAMAAELENHREARALLADGVPEQSAFMRDEETKILIRCRADWTTTHHDVPVIVDYKSTDDANPDEFRWGVGKYDYHMQDSWYRETWDTLTGEAHGFLFIAQSKTPPYLVSVIQLDDFARESGAERNRAARALWLDCMTRDEWPAYPGITTITVPNLRSVPEVTNV
jgi:hypothetical protein